MERIIITIQRQGEDQIRDIEAPADMPVSQLLAKLLRGLGWDIDNFGKPIQYDIKLQSNNDALDAQRSLAELGIWDGSWLILYPQNQGQFATEKRGETPMTGVVRQWKSISPIESSSQETQVKKAPTVPVQWKQIDD